MSRARNNSRMPSNEPFRYSTVAVKKSPTGWGAVMLDDQGEDVFIAVEAWSDAGEALVVDRIAGKLVVVADQPGFQELSEVRQHTFFPAAPGWQLAAHAIPGVAPAYTTPIAAWAQDQGGDVEPVAALPSESTDNPRAEGEYMLRVAGSSRYSIIPPAEKEAF